VPEIQNQKYSELLFETFFWQLLCQLKIENFHAQLTTTIGLLNFHKNLYRLQFNFQKLARL